MKQELLKAITGRRGFTVAGLAILAILYFGSMGRLSLTDPDEVFYSQTAKEMIQHGSYVTPLLFGQPQLEKPPLFYWLLMGAFAVGGVTAWTARLIPALSGFLGVVATVFFCRKALNREIAWLAGVLLSTSILYLLMSKAALTDITLSVLMAVAFYAFYLWVLERRDRYLYVHGVAGALAVLTKGPVAIIVLFLGSVAYLLLRKERGLLRGYLIHPWVLAFVAVCVPWYAAIMTEHGQAFVQEFIIHCNVDRILRAEHSHLDHWWFYPLIIALGIFPWMFYLPTLGRRFQGFAQERLFLLSWCAATLVVFEAAHSKLASYVLPLFPAALILLAIAIASWIHNPTRAILPALLYLALGAVILAVPFVVAERFRPFVTWSTMAGLWMLGAGLITGAVFLWRGRIVEAIVAKASGVALLFILAAGGLPATVDRVVSNAYMRDIVRQEHYEGEPVVTDRRNVRGVYFHSGNPIVVLDHTGHPFWSPHPLQIINTHEEIERFFDARDRVLCELDAPLEHEVERLFEGRRVCRVISRDANKVIVMSESTQPARAGDAGRSGDQGPRPVGHS